MIKVLTTLLATTLFSLALTYLESGGLVVMETEKTSSLPGLWEQQSSLSAYSGSGYLQFLGNTYETGPATSPLEYSFKINQAGLYYLHLHCAKETHDGRTDVANDCYVRVEGDYNAGPGPYTSHGDNASLALLQSNTKYFGGATNAWKWENGQNSSGGNGNLDPGGESNKRVAVYDFKAGETYKLIISGRSKFFRINRIVFRHTSTSASTAQNLSTPESSLITTGNLGYQATTDFPNFTGGTVSYYKDNTRGALAIDASVVADRDKFARAQRAFGGAAGIYDVTITALRELDGECTYRFLVNGVVVASAQNTATTTDYAPLTHVFRNLTIPANATIAVESNTHTNGVIPEGNGTAWARGRWTQIAFSTSTTLIKPPAGRIAVVADGNSPDPDDIGATAVMFGILKRANLRDRLVHLSHSCDLDPFSNPGNQTINAANELRRQNKLHALCGEGIGFFGPFPNLANYYNCRTQQAAAVNDLRDAINASSESDPLWIIEAGEPDVIGYALQAATASARQFVHVISHHPANDNSGDFFTWAQILAFGVTEHQIGDQNVGLQTAISPWDWAQSYPKAGIAWIWDQLKYAEQDGVVAFQTNKFDCSDAGMLYWWMTGASAGGNNASTPVEMRNLLLAGDTESPVAHWRLDEGSGTAAADATGNGYNGTLLNGASWGSDATRSSFVSFDGTDDRISTLFSYALSSSDDFTWAWWANQQSTGTTDDGAIMVGNRYPQPGAGGDTYEFIKLTPTHGQFADTSVVAEIERQNYGAIAQGSWHHYAMVKTATNYQWYVDGVAQGAVTTINYDESAAIPFLIGGDDDGTGTKVNEHFEGAIDDVVLYSRALSAEEVAGVRDGIYSAPEPESRTGILKGLEQDADAREDAVIVNLGSETLVPGKSGGNGGLDRSTVFVFEIPNLGAVENPFLEATLSFNVETVSTAPPGVDLYGLGRRDEATVLAGDYYGETATVDLTDATFIQANLLNGGTGTGAQSSNPGNALTAYLNAQYGGGAGVGGYVFLRLNSNGPITGLQRHFIISADAGGDNGPRISYTALAPDDFGSWLNSRSFPSGADTSREGDPDGDGMSTWAEYLFGLDPSDQSSASPITAGLSKSAGSFSYMRRNPALTGVTDYQIWFSDDLSNWVLDETAGQTPDGDAEIQEVAVTLTGSPRSAPTLFVRVGVN